MVGPDVHKRVARTPRSLLMVRRIGAETPLADSTDGRTEAPLQRDAHDARGPGRSREGPIGPCQACPDAAPREQVRAAPDVQ
eukprot:8632190-Lingulodinium_polyedra.AAC.1